MDYDELRQFADSWGLVYLVVVFVAAVCLHLPSLGPQII